MAIYICRSFGQIYGKSSGDFAEDALYFICYMSMVVVEREGARRGAFPGDRLKLVQWSRSYIVKEGRLGLSRNESRKKKC